VSRADTRLWWLAGEDAADLARQLDQPSAPPSPGAGPARLGIVDPDERKLRLARRLLGEGGPWRGRSDVWYSPAGLVAAGGAVAFLFPGVEPVFGLEDMDLPALGARVGLPAPVVEDGSVAHRTASIYRSGIFLDAALRRLGVRPDVVAGHSIGEWSGSVAAGIVPPAHADDLLGVVDLSAVELPDLDFAAFAAGVGPVAEVVAELDDIVISHDNAPNQSVVCGVPARVEEALARLRARNVLGYRLGFQSGFHTPAMAATLDEFRAHLERMELRPAAVPLWSATTVAPYPGTREDIIALHLRHLCEPVRFRPLVERLYHDAGARVFVQVGVGSLTGFVADTLGDRSHATVPVLASRRSALAQMQRALTALWVEGVELDVAALVGTPAPAPIPEPAYALAGAADMLAAAARASQDVLNALSARLAAAPKVAPAPVAPIRPVATPWPTETVTVRRRLSLDTMPETLDHTLWEAPEGWPDVSDRFPIVAMTTQLQLLEDIARDFAGGRDVVELSAVRNYRWLDISDPLDLDISVVPKGDDTLAIALGPYCRANVRVGTFANRPRYQAQALVDPRPTQHTAREMFDQRLMFHGPAFQGVTALGPVGDDGLLGDFAALDTPGSLLDDLGKLIAYWAIDRAGIGEAALPSGVASVELFGPKPRDGRPVHCDIRVTEVQRDLIRADGVLILEDGTLLARVRGWTSILFHLDELMEPLHHGAGRHDVSEPQPGGWYVVRERWPTGPARDLTARRFLSRPERAEYARLNLAEQRRWLLDTIAAKDAVRRWLRERFGIDSFPVEVTLIPAAERRFRVSCGRIPAGHDPRVTLCPLGWVTVAVLGDGEFRDIEARLVAEAGSPAAAAEQAAAAVAARNPDTPVDSVERPVNVVPCRLEVPDPPPYAVAWTV
jgi:malonyl CoA-acyl carrier protein transacylase